MPTPHSHRDLLALTLVPGVGPRLATALLDRFVTCERVLNATVEELVAVPRIGTDLAKRIVAARERSEADAELARVEKAGVQLLALGTVAYPPMLAGIDDAPHLLYCRGTVTLDDANAVAIVGTRHCSPYGKRMTERLASGLAAAGYCIVSGLARGIDAVAHRAALAAGGRTIAVLANGLERIYPPEHGDLAAEVAASGAILTESAMSQGPQAGLFPARNRIISGLSRAIIVVEAAARSGALITATHAGDQGRTVLAVPGPADFEGSAGCNALIRDGAMLCRGVDDVLEELRGLSGMTQVQPAVRIDPNRPVPAPSTPVPAPPIAPAGPPPGLDPTQRGLWDYLADGPRTVDEITRQLALPVSGLMTMLMMLEMKKVVRRLPGSRYERY